MKSKTRENLRALAIVAVLCSPTFAFAGTTGNEFRPFYNWINGIVSGYFGRAIAIASVAMGALMD